MKARFNIGIVSITPALTSSGAENCVGLDDRSCSKFAANLIDYAVGISLLTNTTFFNPLPRGLLISIRKY